MGFALQSVLVISGDDSHGHFLYYVPTRRVRYEWINTWFIENFALLASRLGPQAVIIVPAHGRDDEYRASVARAGVELRITRTYDKNDPPLDETGHPFLLVSRRPIGHALDRRQGGDQDIDFAAINLAAYRDKGQLSVLMDSLVEGATRGVDLLSAIPAIETYLRDEGDEGLSDVLELKPNVYGIGINMNALIRRLRRPDRDRRR